MKQNNKKITEKILKEVFPIGEYGLELLEEQGDLYSIKKAISLALKEKDAEIKCTNCGKELPRSMMAVECPDCYLLGFKKELKKKDAKIKKVIDECKEYKEVTGVMDSDGASPVISKEELKQKLNLK